MTRSCVNGSACSRPRGAGSATGGLHVLLRREGQVVNRKRTQRLYREEGLSVRRRRGRKRATGTRAPLTTLAVPNARWSVDFVHDPLGLWPALPRLQRLG